VSDFDISSPHKCALLNNDTPVNTVRSASGCDLKVDGDLMVRGSTMYNQSCAVVYQNFTFVNGDIPYIPGLLCFRERPITMSCLRQFSLDCPDIQIDVPLVDGRAIWHPRAFRIAGDVGLESILPTISTPFNPIFISPGHRIDYESAISLVRTLCHFREPEPLRLADRISRSFVRKQKRRQA
jgi:deoxyinosine 3'endonuclease (endonuclease V)